eukprot:276909-Prorocentrum_minimum.AAC.1
MRGRLLRAVVAAAAAGGAATAERALKALLVEGTRRASAVSAGDVCRLREAVRTLACDALLPLGAALTGLGQADAVSGLIRPRALDSCTP